MDSIHSPVEHGENHQEATMKTPHAILIGLSLIAAAIFFKDTATNFNFVKDAHAASHEAAYYKCYFGKMDEVNTEGSHNTLKHYCLRHN